MLHLLIFQLIILAREAHGSDIVSKSHRLVCVRPYLGLDYCPTSKSQGFSGYEPEVFKLLTSALSENGHTEWSNGNWSFSCVVPETYNTSQCPSACINVSLAYDQCDVFMSGILADQATGKLGGKLSAATLTGGRRIVVFKSSGGNLWSFLSPFEWRVWLLMFSSTVVVALSILLLEFIWTTGSKPGQASPLFSWSRYSDIQWASTGLMLRGVFELTPSSPGSRIVQLGAAFVALLLSGLYVGSYSSQLSKGGLTTRISSLGDLIYEPTGIWDGDQQAFSVFGLQNLVLLPWIASTDVDAMITKLRHKEITALIIDATVADYITSSNCDLYLVGDLLLPNVIGYLFQPSVPDDYIFLFDSAIRSLDSSGDLLQLQDMYLHPIATCSIKGNDVNTQAPTQIALADIGGVWVFVAAGIGLGLLLNLLGELRLWIRKTNEGDSARGGRSSIYTVPSKAASETITSPPPGAPSTDLTFNIDNGEWREPVTMDESLLEVHQQLDQVLSHIHQLPNNFSSVMDLKLSELRSELATVMAGQIIKRAGTSNNLGTTYQGHSQLTRLGVNSKDAQHMSGKLSTKSGERESEGDGIAIDHHPTN